MDDTSPENLRKFIESEDPALRMMGLSIAKGTLVKVPPIDMVQLRAAEVVRDNAQVKLVAAIKQVNAAGKGGALEGRFSLLLDARQGRRVLSNHLPEVEELVDNTELDPNEIHTPGIFVQRIFQGENYVKPIEQRTVRVRP